MSKSKSSFIKNVSQDLWERDGKIDPYLAEMKTDKCLCSSIVRNELVKPHTFVTYDPKSVYSDLNEHGADIYFIKVVPVNNPQAEASLVSTCMLDLTKRQRKCLSKHHGVPASAFEKHAVALHVEVEVDPPQLSIEDEIDEIIFENHACFAELD